MQTMDADLARLVRGGKITRSLAQQRASVPEELKRLLGAEPVTAPMAMGLDGNGDYGHAGAATPTYATEG
jgi:hypothetical protein